MSDSKPADPDNVDLGAIPYDLPRLAPDEAARRGEEFVALCRARRSVRDFSTDPVPLALVDRAIEAAGLAPSGANQQPWTFVVVGDADLKRRIRAAAEHEERTNYEGGRMSPEWRAAISHLGTDWHKPHITDAPWVIVVFEQTTGPADPATGRAPKHYYVKESVGIAVGFLLVALQAMGLAALTHTPSPMNFLRDLLGRPHSEKAFVLIPVGYPAAGCRVPAISKKAPGEIRVVR